MADVEKININNTDYDIADAKALRNKNNTPAENAFIDSRAGTTGYPTNSATSSVVIGHQAQIRYVGNRLGEVVIGNEAHVAQSYSTVVGYQAHATMDMGTAFGYNANSAGSQAISIGPNSQANANYGVTVGGSAVNSGLYSVAVGQQSQNTGGQFNTAIGASATTRGNNYNTVLGANSNTGTNSGYNVICGSGSTIPNYVSYASSLGANANARSSYSVQLGAGNNYNYGSLQFRDWPLVNSNGKIYEERLPDSIRTTTPRFPNLYDINEEKVSEQAILYTGPENDSFKSDTFYFGRVRYGYPRFYCSWADSEWIDSQNDVMIDQQKFFAKLAEVTKQRIDDDDIENGVMGGDSAEMSIYLKYDADNDYYFLDFDSDSFEKAFNGQSDDITGLSFDDLADYGIYFKNFHKPSDLEGEYEFCDIYYYAPVYIDGYDWNNNPSYINYFQFLEAMNDSDWGIGVVIPHYNTWEYEVDGTNYLCPIIPKTYEYDGSEYDGVDIRWEWTGEYWEQFINGVDIDYSWSTEQMYTTFGIKIEEGEEENIEYINFYIRGGEQRYWEEVDYAKQEDLDALSEQVSPLFNWRVQEKTGTSYDFNDFRTPGWYYFPNATMFTNKPTNMGIGCMLLVQKNKNNYISQHVFVTAPSHNWNGSSYTLNAPAIFSRVYNTAIWGNWNMYMTTGSMADLIPEFDATKKQYLAHSANSIDLKWEEGSSSVPTYDSTNERITW